MIRDRGYYFGTEVNNKWWKRYKQDGFFARGNGTFWIEYDGFHFKKYLGKELIIPFDLIHEVRVGRMHSGKWTPFVKVVKIIWMKDNQKLSSGFRIAFRKEKIKKYIIEIESRIKTGFQY